MSQIIIYLSFLTFSSLDLCCWGFFTFNLCVCGFQFVRPDIICLVFFSLFSQIVYEKEISLLFTKFLFSYVKF